MASRQLGGLLLRPSTSLRALSLRPIHSNGLPAISAIQPLPRGVNYLSTRPSPKPTRSATQPQSGAPSTEALEEFMRTPSSHSAADELSAYRESFGTNFSPRQRRTSMDLDRMAQAPVPKSQSLSSFPAAPPLEQEERDHYPRLDPTTGRTVELNDRGRDLVRGLAMLNMLIARNNVRRDFYMQRFHERPGLKRKRLKSERWRKRFKEGFKQVVSRVSKLTAKGW